MKMKSIVEMSVITMQSLVKMMVIRVKSLVKMMGTVKTPTSAAALTLIS